MNLSTFKRVEQWVVAVSGGLKMVYRRYAGKRPSALLTQLIASGVKGSGVLAAAFPLMVFAGPASNALPTGGQVVAGQTTIGAPQSTANGGTRMDVHQASAQTIINWQTFNVGSNAHINFNQPNSSAVALNRVAAGNPSDIQGQITANGSVFLVNPSGVLVGPGAQVNVGSFAASTLDISDQDFLNRNYKFTGGNKGGTITNQGMISAGIGGYVALLAPEVRNEGVVIARLGTVAIGAGDKIEMQMQGDRLITLKVSGAAIDTLIENKHAIRAPGGHIILAASAASSLTKSVVNNSGIIEATTLADLQGQQHKGRIEISASTVMNTGTISVNGDQSGQTAGDIAIRGGFVSLGGSISADGAAQGGSISVVAGRTLSLADQISARGLSGTGGRIALISEGQIVENQSSSNNVSGLIDGGVISVQADAGVISSGSYAANGAQGVGGRVDISGHSVRLLSAQISATGATQGGLVRVGGSYQGGKSQDPISPTNPDPLNPAAPQPTTAALPLLDRFVTRWGITNGISNAERTFINDSSKIDVSAKGLNAQGGTAIVWSNTETTMLGSVDARGGAGGLTGGVIEISSKENLRYVALDNILAGSGGQLLLDPRNLTIGNVTDTRAWTMAAITGFGYSGNGSGQLSLSANEGFGQAVTLNATGDLLAVGIPNANSFDQTELSLGSVRLYGFTAGTSTFGGAALLGVIGKGYTGGNNFNMSTLTNGDNFGSSVSLNGVGDKLAVGSVTANSSDGRVSLFSFGSRITGFIRNHQRCKRRRRKFWQRRST
jgi:filamentous hemagglutinin family protein